MATFLINGAQQTLPGTPSLAHALLALGLGGKRLAVECNGQIVPRSQHDSHLLTDGDRVEIVVAVGGG